MCTRNSRSEWNGGRDKTAANFCDHLKPKVGAYAAPTGEADAAKAALEALFGKK